MIDFVSPELMFLEDRAKLHLSRISLDSCFGYCGKTHLIPANDEKRVESFQNQTPQYKNSVLKWNNPLFTSIALLLSVLERKHASDPSDVSKTFRLLSVVIQDVRD